MDFFAWIQGLLFQTGCLCSAPERLPLLNNSRLLYIKSCQTLSSLKFMEFSLQMFNAG